MQQQPERRDGGQDLLEQCARHRVSVVWKITDRL
jgi:hypothetical protein